MDPSIPKNIIDWDESDLTTLIDTGTEDQFEEIPSNQRYEDLDHQSLEVIAKNLSDGIENRSFSLSLAENIESMEKKGAITKRLERSLDRSRYELHRVREELKSRPEVPRLTTHSFPIPRTVPEFVKDINLTLLSQILNGSFGLDTSEFYHRYLTFIEFSRSHDITFGQIEEIFRIFLRHDMLTYWLDQDTEMSTLEKLRGLLTIYFKGPTVSDRLRQIKEFERGQSESLESAILRLTLLLDKTEMLFPRKQRETRREIFVSNAISRLSHPLVRPKVERFKREVFMSRRFLSNDQLLKKCSEMESLGGFSENEPIKLNYDDPFLSNEAKNSLMDRNKQKYEKTVKISEGIRDNHGNKPSIHSELDEVKRILKSMNIRYRDQQPSGGHTRNFHQNMPNRSEFDGRNRYLRNDFRNRSPKPANPDYYNHQDNQTGYRRNNWTENGARSNANGTNTDYRRRFQNQFSPNPPNPIGNSEPRSLPSNGPATQRTDGQMDKNFRTNTLPKESVRVEELSDFAKATTN